MPIMPITITGNLTKDPWLKKLQSGNCLGKLRIAANRRIRDENAKGGWRDVDNLYLSVECWGQLAFNIKKSLKKGMPVIVSGVLVTHEWVDEKTREPQQRIVLRANQVGLDLGRHIIGSRKSEPLEYNVDGIPIPDLEADEHFFDDEQEDEPGLRSSFDRGLDRGPGHQSDDVSAAVSDLGEPTIREGEGSEDDREPVGVGAGQGGAPPF